VQEDWEQHADRSPRDRWPLAAGRWPLAGKAIRSGSRSTPDQRNRDMSCTAAAHVTILPIKRLNVAS
jgi:hypothetical protein